MTFKTNFMLDVMWLGRVSYKLDKFKRMSPSSHTYACRCMVCGDSQSKANKLSFYFYTKKGSLNFECKRCGYSGSFWRFIHEQFPQDAEDYKREFYKERLDSFKRPTTRNNHVDVSNHQKTEQIDSTRLKSRPKGTVALSDLTDSHKAVKYLIGRGFLRDQIDKLLYAENFKITAADCMNQSVEELGDDFPTEPRIVIPFYTEDGTHVEMMQGRSLNPKSFMRYITIKSHPDVDKVFGKNLVDRNKTVYCVEGPFDSLFIDNCLAACDANLARSDADVLIWDNEPRSVNIVKYMTRAIDDGRSIVIWPTSPDSKQDINDLILMGLDTNTLMEVIKERTFNGLMAKLELTKWRKV